MMAKNLIWANSEKTLINCEIEHTVFGWIPFSASHVDVEAHGRELFDKLKAGDFGPIAEYIAPPPPAPAPELTKPA